MKLWYRYYSDSKLFYVWTKDDYDYLISKGLIKNNLKSFKYWGSFLSEEDYAEEFMAYVFRIDNAPQSLLHKLNIFKPRKSDK